MAEPIGIASGILALTAFAFEACRVLHDCVQSIQNNNRNIRELKNEIEGLSGVLASLQELVPTDDDRFENLKAPLLYCGEACKNYQELLAKCIKHSDDPGTSFRDWARLKYAGSDITGFKNILAGYKQTISIALGDANLRTATVTANAIKEFKQTLADTKTDLEDHRDDLNNHLESLRIDDATATEDSKAQHEQILKEIKSVNECLAVCAKASIHVETVKVNVFEDVKAAKDAHQVIVSTFGELISAKRVTADIGARQYLGQMSDAALRDLHSSRGSNNNEQGPAVGTSEKGSKQFVDAYGTGHKLA